MSAPAPQSPLGELADMVRSRLSAERMGGRVARGAVKTIAVNGTGAAASFVVQIALAQLLGREAFGAYLLTMGWLSVALLMGKLEQDTTSVRFVGSYVATGSWGLLRGFLKTSHRAVTIASVAIAAVAVAGILMFPEALRDKHPQFTGALLVAAAILPFFSLLMLEGCVLQGFQQYARAQLPLNLLRPVAFGAVVWVMAIVVRSGVTVPLAVAANLAAVVVALAVAWTWRRQATPAEARVAAPAFDRGTWARTAYPLFAVSLAQLIISQQSDVIVVGTMLSTAEAAVYGAASQLTLPLVLAASSVTFVAQPLISDLYAREPRRLQSLIRVVTYASIVLAVPVAAGLIALGPWLLRLYGEGFEAGHTVLVILTLAQLVVGLVGALAGFLLTMTSHERDAAWIIGGSAVLNIGLALLLTPRFGAVGTASATLTAAIVRATLLAVHIRRTMGLRLPAF